MLWESKGNKDTYKFVNHLHNNNFKGHRIYLDFLL